MPAKSDAPHPRDALFSGEKPFPEKRDRKSTRLNSSHTVIYTLSLHDALPISPRIDISPDPSHARQVGRPASPRRTLFRREALPGKERSEEHTSELQSHRDLHSFPTRRSSDLP